MAIVATIIKGVVLLGGAVFVASKLQKKQAPPRKRAPGNGGLPSVTDLPKPTDKPVGPPPNYIRIDDPAQFEKYGNEYTAPLMEGKPIPPLVVIGISDESLVALVINAARGDLLVIYLLTTMSTIRSTNPIGIPADTWAGVGATNMKGALKEPILLPAGSTGADLLGAIMQASTFAKAED